MDWTFSDTEIDRADVQTLLAAHFLALRSISPPDACHVLSAGEYSSAALTLWSLRANRTLLAIGALKQLSPDHGELKSMRVAPHALGQGAGKAMLRHIMAIASARGYRRLSLETGSTEPFVPALRLYESHGFERCGPFADYRPTPFTVFMTRSL